MPDLRQLGATRSKGALVALQEDEVARLRRRGFRLEYASMAWMTVEAAVAIVSGIVASSIALIGFGLDSVIEFFAAAVVVWQLHGTVSEERETPALRLIGGTFFALAAYLTVESIIDLVNQNRPEQSTAGIAVTAAALIVMPLLALAKAAGFSHGRGCQRDLGMGNHPPGRQRRLRLQYWLSALWRSAAGRSGSPHGVVTGSAAVRTFYLGSDCEDTGSSIL